MHSSGRRTPLAWIESKKTDNSLGTGRGTGETKTSAGMPTPLSELGNVFKNEDDVAELAKGAGEEGNFSDQGCGPLPQGGRANMSVRKRFVLE